MNPVYYDIFDTPLGQAMIASHGAVAQETLFAPMDGQALSGLWFVGQKYAATPGPHWQRQHHNPVLVATRDQLECYFDATEDSPAAGGRQPPAGFQLPLALSGTAFQQEVWQQLLHIKPGETQTYGQVAAAIGRPRSVRAVAAAIGRNPVSIIVPCHRVLGANGSLTGYAGGLHRKQALLEREGALLPV